MTVTNSDLDSTVWDTIRTILVAYKPYVINSTTSETTFAGIEGTYNDKIPSKPTIVVEPMSLDETFDKFGSNDGKKFINITVSCYATKNKEVDELSAQVRDAISNAVIDGMELVGVSSNPAFLNPNLIKYNLKTLTFSFDRE